MNELKIFENKEFGKIRTIIIDGKPYFSAKDVATALGYKRPIDAVTAHCRYSVKWSVPHPQNPDKQIKMSFIPEGDIYRLIVRSKLPSAERFEKWVFDEVLPSIRKHGVYATDDFIELSLNNPDYAIKLLTQLKEERQKRKQAENKIEQQKPFVEFANKVSDSSNLISVGTMAKLLKDEHINIGRNKLFKWLRDNNILMDNNIPYQKYISNGYFKVVESVYETPYGTQTQQTTFVTGKGQIYIVERLRKEWR